MTSENDGPSQHYWYSDGAESAPGIRALEAMRAYGAAEAAMRRRSERALKMSENDISAMRYLLRAQEGGRSVGPKEIAEYLGIQSSSVTVLLDRLERSGHVRRESSPFDRRALIVVPNVPTDELQRAILGDVREELVAVAETLDEAEAEVVVRFLHELRDAVDRIDTPASAPARTRSSAKTS